MESPGRVARFVRRLLFMSKSPVFG
jgi:hypothetical protein